MNSPWGLLAIIAEKTGWTYDYILHGISWINLQLMLADSPKSVKESQSSFDYQFDNMEEATQSDINNFINE